MPAGLVDETYEEPRSIAAKLRPRKRQRTERKAAVRPNRRPTTQDQTSRGNEHHSDDKEDDEDVWEEENEIDLGSHSYNTSRSSRRQYSLPHPSSLFDQRITRAKAPHLLRTRLGSLPRLMSPAQVKRRRSRTEGPSPFTTGKRGGFKACQDWPPSSSAPPPSRFAGGKSRVLSPLPVNHSLPSRVLAKEKAILSHISPSKQSRLKRPLVRLARMHRGTPRATVPMVRGATQRARKRTRGVAFSNPVHGESNSDANSADGDFTFVESDSGEENTNLVRDVEYESEEVEETKENETHMAPMRRLRSADAHVGWDFAKGFAHGRRIQDHIMEIDHDESEEGDPIEEEKLNEEEYVDEVENDVDMTDEDDHHHLYVAPMSALRRLRRADLVRLYVIATAESFSTTRTLTKDALIAAIIEARPEPDLDNSDEGVDKEDGNESPRPFTSQEGSPEPRRPRRPIRQDMRIVRKGRRSIQLVPTPPPTSGESSASQDSESDGGKSEAQRARNSAVRFAGLTLPKRKRSASNAAIFEAENRTRQLRNGKSVGPLSNPGKQVALSPGAAVQVEVEVFTSPIAHRTRHGSLVSPAHSPEIRPARAAKARAADRIRGRPLSDGDSDDDGDNEDEDSDVGVEEEWVARSDDEDLGNFPRPFQSGRPRRLKPKQIETPPSDRDESPTASDDEAEDEEVSKVLTMYHRTPRKLRNGKLVAMGAVTRRVGAMQLEDEEVSEEEDEDDDDDEEDEDDGTDEQGDEDEPADENEGDLMDESEAEVIDLSQATSKSLLRCRRDDLVRLCEERDIDGDGTKKDLVHALLRWRDHDTASSIESSHGSANSTTSVATARAETKSQALRAAVASETAGNAGAPLLMRRHHSRHSSKPFTPAHSKADEQEEVNALDLESLQLLDKEIPADKLTKLEKVGSGGFKDVFKGLYRKKTIAIADIRGHLTDMDIKELGLLRDLRHKNIVHFIGVSIPKDPISSVPVMIVTELCANGDLFDYIRGVPHPSFAAMLEIMLGTACGVDYLHSRKPSIIHRDIKSSNVLITAHGVAKINDFGLARVKTSTRSMIRSLVGTVNWQAPELWVPHPRYNEKVDVYSVGLVFWEVLQWHQPVKRYPFEGLNEHAIYDSVGQKQLRPSTASMGRQWGAEILNLISSMWAQNPSERPTMSQVCSELEDMLQKTKEKEGEKQELRKNSRLH